jgi:hypothetical protein
VKLGLKLVFSLFFTFSVLDMALVLVCWLLFFFLFCFKQLTKKATCHDVDGKMARACWKRVSQ